jgi:hypothetical protein
VVVEGASLGVSEEEDGTADGTGDVAHEHGTEAILLAGMLGRRQVLGENAGEVSLGANQGSDFV